MTTATAARNSDKAAKRKAAAEALHADLIAQVDTMRDSEQWVRFLDFARAFHNYSISNVLLMLRQRPEATQAAGFRKWQTLGRQVRKGEKAMRIFGYSTKKVTVTDEDTGEDVEKKITIYPMLSVFDISQTDQIDGADPVPEIAHRLTGADDAGIFAAVAAWLTDQGWSIEVETIDGETNGYTTTDGTRRVVISTGISDAQAAKTIIHEAAHAILHTDDDGNDNADYVAHRGLCETEAESVAYVVAGLLGVDTSAYSIGYIAGWSQCDTEMIQDTAANVLRAAHIIADGIDTTDTDN